MNNKWTFHESKEAELLTSSPSTSFCYTGKAKKRPWSTSNTWLKFAQIEGKSSRINYGIRERWYSKHQQPYHSLPQSLEYKARNRNKIKTVCGISRSYCRLGFLVNWKWNNKIYKPWKVDDRTKTRTKPRYELRKVVRGIKLKNRLKIVEAF